MRKEVREKTEKEKRRLEKRERTGEQTGMLAALGVAAMSV